MIFILLIPIYFLSFIFASLIALRLLGIQNNLVKRSLIFGSVIAVIQVLPQLILTPIFGQVGLFFGGLIAMLATYAYVAKILNISSIKNIAIVVFLPLFSWVIVAGLYLLILEFMGSTINA